MCSKKCAKPDLPGSTSLREPVWTGICSDTRLGKPVGTTITRRPFGSVRSAGVEGKDAARGARGLGGGGHGQQRRGEEGGDGDGCEP